MTLSLEELSKLAEYKKSRQTTINTSVGTFSLLGIAFIVLKLTGCITWSWFWVLAPFWISICLSILIALFIFLMLWLIVKYDKKDINPVVEIEIAKEEPKEKVKEDESQKEQNTSEKVVKKTSTKKKSNGRSTKNKNEKTSK